MAIIPQYRITEDGDRRITEDGENRIIDIRVVLPVPPVETFDSVLRTHHAPIARLEFWDDDLKVLELTIPNQLLGGSVNMDRSSDVFSTASVSVVNDDGSLSVEDDKVWPNRIVRVSKGALVNGKPVYRPIITGPIAEPKGSFASGGVSFSVASRFAIAKRQFSGPYTVAAGGTGAQAIRELLELGGLGTDARLYDLDDGGYTVLVARTFDTKDEILGSAVKWAFDMGCDLWPDGFGVAKMRPFADATAQATAWDFGTDTLLSFEHTERGQQVYNRQEVIGRFPDGYTFTVEAKITNPSHPFFWREDRDLPAEPYDSKGTISDTTTALNVALRLLRERSTIEETIQASALWAPVFPNELVSFSGAQRSQAFLLDRASLRIESSAMQVEVRRVVGTAPRSFPPPIFPPGPPSTNNPLPNNVTFDHNNIIVENPDSEFTWDDSHFVATGTLFDWSSADGSVHGTYEWDGSTWAPV